jgi:hypothetical protein
MDIWEFPPVQTAVMSAIPFSKEKGHILVNAPELLYYT